MANLPPLPFDFGALANMGMNMLSSIFAAIVPVAILLVLTTTGLRWLTNAIGGQVSAQQNPEDERYAFYQQQRTSLKAAGFRKRQIDAMMPDDVLERDRLEQRKKRRAARREAKRRREESRSFLDRLLD